jgi:hypothetical protein
LVPFSALAAARGNLFPATCGVVELRSTWQAEPPDTQSYLYMQSGLKPAAS